MDKLDSKFKEVSLVEGGTPNLRVMVDFFNRHVVIINVPRTSPPYKRLLDKGYTEVAVVKGENLRPFVDKVFFNPHDKFPKT